MDILYFSGGLFLGLALATGIAFFRIQEIKSLHKNILDDYINRQKEETERLTQQMKDTFGALSLEALSKNTEEFLKYAQEKLSQETVSNQKDMSGKKELIDQTLKSMKSELEKVNQMVTGIEKDRKAKFDVLTEQITKSADETRQLRETAHSLKSALSNSRVRGQWGERMAEDVLRLAGFVEGINYRKQVSDTEGGRPDFTFYLPQNRIVNMDVKFPLENYLNFMEADNDTERAKFLDMFLKDTKRRIEEVTKRSYIDNNGDTLDYVLVFIPNEQVYAFINEHDRGMIDQALSKKIILCSPTTLYAVLAVIRQAVDNFHLERTASEILGVLGDFHRQWDKFTEAMDKVGRKIEDSQKAFQDLAGVRRRQLEKPLDRINDLRTNEKLIENDAPTLKVIENE